MTMRIASGVLAVVAGTAMIWLLATLGAEAAAQLAAALGGIP